MLKIESCYYLELKIKESFWKLAYLGAIFNPQPRTWDSVRPMRGARWNQGVELICMQVVTYVVKKVEHRKKKQA